LELAATVARVRNSWIVSDDVSISLSSNEYSQLCLINTVAGTTRTYETNFRWWFKFLHLLLSKLETKYTVHKGYILKKQ